MAGKGDKTNSHKAENIELVYQWKKKQQINLFTGIHELFSHQYRRENIMHGWWRTFNGEPKGVLCVCMFTVAFYLTWLTRAFEWRVNQNKFNKIFTENVQFKICPNQNIYNKPQHSDTLITVGILASIENSFVCFVCRLVCRCLASPPKFSSDSETDGIVYVNIYVFVFDCFAVFVIQIMRIIFSGVLCLFYNVRVWVCMSLCKPKKSMRRYEISSEILVCLSEMKCRMFFHGKCFRFYFQCIAYKDIKINISRLQRENVRLPYETVFFRLLLLQFILW